MCSSHPGHEGRRRFVHALNAGNPEPVTIGKDGKAALDVRTITFETRVLEDDEDKVLRRTMHATSASALQAQAASAATIVSPCHSQAVTKAPACNRERRG